MGVSGVGKTTIGTLLSERLSIPYFDGDAFHPKENIEKMTSGHPLNDNDRLGWLKSLNTLAKEQQEIKGCIIGCSALKEKYRDLLKTNIENDVKWIFLTGSYELIVNRLESRKGHYMPPSLLQSQLDSLEIPVDAITINIEKPPEEIVEMLTAEILKKSDFGLIGLGVMGKSLSRNLVAKGFDISVYNRHVPGTEENIARDFKNEFEELKEILAFDDLKSFIDSLQKPRKIMLMVNAGKAVDAVIDDLLPFLSENDIIIDGGNSHYKDTARREAFLAEKTVFFIGAGISGGEEGALTGPSIMPGGEEKAYKMIKPFLETIAAKDKKGKPCCTYIGSSGSGHFTKMIHNGIEYAEMQLLTEIYQIFKSTGKNPDEIAKMLLQRENVMDSYLLEITIEILKKKENGEWLINKILDKAENKGTGNWTTIAAAELGIPNTMIASSLFARYISSFKEERLKLNPLFSHESNSLQLNSGEILKAYQLARIINHAQGFKLLNEASKAYNWQLNLSEIARIWTNGCIIRSTLMEELVNVLEKNENLFYDKNILESVKELKPALSETVPECIKNSIPIPCLSEAINYLNAITLSESPANLIQAQRDYFGAHTYQRTDDESGEFHHTHWKKANL
ncbi:NADP-dependent phosphogluconate dehydrogenase [Marivirga sp. S37H4]|uniref:6-phosphogluconate dehydrogenase, decarboxylating n=2 Tax=Marivirga aurantiaca TaxID=2802615 RepID=A0A935C7B2_9BACT|nr:NADP-dependent phosphogluconate dehydrogenase [Marivirga aurantiaca]